MNVFINLTNSTHLHLKIYELGPNGDLGKFIHLMAPFSTYEMHYSCDQKFIPTLALNNGFKLNVLDTSKTKATDDVKIVKKEFTHEDLKSTSNALPELIPALKKLGFPATGMQGKLMWDGPAESGQLFLMQNRKETSISKNDQEGFTGVEPGNLYVVKSTDASQTILGYFATTTPINYTISGSNVSNNKYSPYDVNNPISASNPNATFRLSAGNTPSSLTKFQQQSWSIPSIIQGTKTANGTLTIERGSSKGRLTNGDTKLHLYSHEIAVFEKPNFAQGKFWIIKGDCNDLSAYIASTPGIISPTGNRSVQLGPGTMAILNPKAGNENEIGKSNGNVSITSGFKLLNIEAPSSAGLTIHNELAQQYVDGEAYFRTTIVAGSHNVLIPKEVKKPEVVKKELTESSLKPGIPKQLTIESETPVHGVIINGDTKNPITLYPYDYPGQNPLVVKFNKINQVEILIPPTSKNIRVPNLFFCTDKMHTNLRVMNDPNKEMHKRLASGSIQMGKKQLTTLDIEGAAKNGTSLGKGVHSWLNPKDSHDKSNAEKNWTHIVNMTKQSNKAVLHVHKKDATGTHLHSHVDASHMGEFEDHHFSFDSSKNTPGSTTPYLTEVKKGAGLYRDFVAGKEIHPLKKFPASSNGGAGSMALTVDEVEGISDWWHDVKNVVVTVGHSIEEGVESAIHVVVEKLDGLYHLALTAAHDVAMVLTKIYDAIKLAITKLIDFIKLLISLLENSKAFCQAINQTLLDSGKHISDILGPLADGSKSINKDISSFFDKIGVHTTQSGSHQSTSNSEVNSAFEKLHWLMNLITNAQHPTSLPSSGSLSDAVNQIKGDIISLTSSAVTSGENAIANFVKNPKNAGNEMQQFMSHLAGNIESEIENVVQVSAKGLENAVDSTLNGSISGVPTAVNDVFKLLTGMSFTPASMISMVIGVPATLLYGIIKEEVPDAPHTFWSNPNSESMALTLEASAPPTFQAEFALAMGMITDLFSMVAAPLTISNAKSGEGEDAKFLRLFMGAGKFALSTVSAISCNTSWKHEQAIFRNIMINYGMFRGLWGVAAATQDLEDLAKINCTIDAFMGLIKIFCGVNMLTGDLKVTHKDANAVIQFSEGAGMVSEVDGLINLGELDVVLIGCSAVAPLVGAGAKLYLLAKS